jgi:hypothetical protein
MINYFNFSRIEENIFFNSVASLKSLLPPSVYFSPFVFGFYYLVLIKHPEKLY